MPARGSSEEEAEEGVGALAEGRTEEVDAVPAALHEDALGVAEAIAVTTGINDRLTG